MNTTRRKHVHQFKETARQDSYRLQNRPQGTPQCSVCKSVQLRGRWLSLEQMKTLHGPGVMTGKVKCPACKQLEDHFAMGVVELHGEIEKDKKDLVMNTIRHTEQIARNRNDQERVLWIREMEDVTKVYVSLPELARHIGRELERSFQGMTKYTRSKEEPYLRVSWHSDLPHMKHRPGAPFAFKGARPSLLRMQPTHKSKAFRTRSRKA